MYCGPETNPSWAKSLLTKAFQKGTQQYFRVDWDMLVVHESSGLESYKG